MAKLPLTKGYVTIVDDDDYEKLSKIGEVSWCADDTYKTRVYAKKRVAGKSVRLHRFIYELNGIEIPNKREIDHINGDTLDNRKSNLRIVSRSENNANMRIRKDNTTGYKGVFKKPYGKKPYWAYVRKHGKRYGLGMYATAEEAAKAYNEKALELYKDNALLNRI